VAADRDAGNAQPSGARLISWLLVDGDIRQRLVAHPPLQSRVRGERRGFIDHGDHFSQGFRHVSVNMPRFLVAL
jgi:hypothetical protein